MKIILPAKDIPEGSIVMKPTGSKEYRLRKDGVKLYDEKGVSTHIAKGCCVLQSENSLNVIEKDAQLCVEFHYVKDAIAFLEQIDQQEE